MRSSNSILMSSSDRPGRSARRTKWSSVSTRSIAGTQRRSAPVAGRGASKTVLNRRFISFWSVRAHGAAPSARRSWHPPEGDRKLLAEYRNLSRDVSSFLVAATKSAAPGTHAVPEPASARSSSGSKCCRKRSRTPSRCVRRARGEQRLALGGEHGEGAAPVVGARVALQQPVALEPVDQPGHARAREQHAVGQLGHPPPVARRGLQVDQDLVGGERELVGGEQLRVERLDERAVDPQQARARPPAPPARARGSARSACLPVWPSPDSLATRWLHEQFQSGGVR